MFPIPVRPKVDGARGDDADEGWAEAFEEGSRGFVVVDVFDNVACFDKVIEEASVVVVEGKREGDGGGGRKEDRSGVYFEEGGLEAGFYNVKGACDDCSAHSA
jgi:hypothetical protein